MGKREKSIDYRLLLADLCLNVWRQENMGRDSDLNAVDLEYTDFQNSRPQRVGCQVPAN